MQGIQAVIAPDTSWADTKWRQLVVLHRPEVVAVAIGFAVRFLTFATFDPVGGYDFSDHWLHLTWYLEHFSLTPTNYSRTAYHAPLYHFLAGLLLRVGVGKTTLQLLSTLLGCVRIAFIAVGLNLALPRSPRARVLGLLLVAVLPCSVQLDGMVTQESFNNTLVVISLVLMLLMLRAPPDRRLRWALLIGVTAGLALLTKVSSVMLAVMVLGGGPLEAALTPAASWRARFSRLQPWLVAVAMMGAVGGWWYVRSQIVNGKAFVTGWDLGIDGGLGPEAALPVLDRRTIGYVTMWSSEVFSDPHYPAASGEHPRFWPVLVASTFVDYYKFHFAGPSLQHARGFSRISVIAGTYITALTTIAWVVLLFFSIRGRSVFHVLALLLPMLGVLGQLSFAIQFPYDTEGVVKGLYLHFSMAPLYGVFGIAIDWLWRRPAGRPAAALGLLSLAGVASYVLYCRIF